MKGVAADLLVGFDWFVLAYFVVLNASYLMLIVVAASETARSMQRPDKPNHDDIFSNPLTPGISIIVPAYNEEVGIVESVRAMLGLRYPNFEVVVVEDGSTDHTFERLCNEFDLVETPMILEDDFPMVGAPRSMHVPRGGEPLVVVRKINVKRRSDTLNVGLNAARHPLVCCVDADSILETDALLHVARPFVEDPEHVVASGGVIRAVNGCSVYRGQLTRVRQPDGWVARIQVMEYLRSFLVGRTGWSRVEALLIISGAFGLFRRDLLAEVGGFDPTSLGEDADLIASLHRRLRDRDEDYRVVFVPQPVCWTEVPSTLDMLARQRRRWSHGMAQLLWKQRSMMLNPRYGRIGMVTLPYYLAFECLGPVVELVGLAAIMIGFALGIVSWQFALVFAVAAVLFGVVLSVSALLIEEVAFHRYTRWRDLGIGVLAAVIENFGYRQLHAWWRLQGLVSFVRGHEPAWGEMVRVGFGSDDGHDVVRRLA